jgi:Protein of unknown function (DUF4232)
MRSSAARSAVAAAALLGVAAFTAACGPKAHQAAGSGTKPASPATAPASSAASSPTAAAPASPSASASAAATGCASSALKASVNVTQVGAAAGSFYYPIVFTNTSNTSCTMFGYPGVSFAASDGGARIGRAARREPAPPPSMVTLAPGGVAHATLQVGEAANYGPAQCKPVQAHWLKIYPPNQFAPIYAHFSTQACSAMLPRHGGQLAVFVVRPGAGKAGQAP